MKPAQSKRLLDQLLAEIAPANDAQSFPDLFAVEDKIREFQLIAEATPALPASVLQRMEADGAFQSNSIRQHLDVLRIYVTTAIRLLEAEIESSSEEDAVTGSRPSGAGGGTGGKPWDEREGPILRALSKFERSGIRPNFKDIVRTTGLQETAAEFGLESLLDAGYVAGIDSRSMDGFDYLELRLLPLGRQAIGEWYHAPHSDSDQITSDEGGVALRLFISHSSRDAAFVSLLISLLRNALSLPAREIRCTSVDGYRLPAGANTKEQLRYEIHQASTFIGIISDSSLQSSFVMFELGARWGANKHLAPVLAPDVEPSVLRGPLQDFNALRGDSAAQLHQLIQDLAETLGINPSSPAAYQDSLERILKLSTHTRV